MEKMRTLQQISKRNENETNSFLNGINATGRLHEGKQRES